MKRSFIAVWLLLLVGCGTAPRVVRLDTGETHPLAFEPRSHAQPVRLESDEFKAAVAVRAREVRLPARIQDAARRLFEMDARTGSFEYNGRTRRLSAALQPGDALEEEPTRIEAELTSDYLRWCERTGRPGDCLHLLEEGSTLNGDGRYTLAMALAKGVVLDEMLEAFKGMADPHAMVSAVLWTCTTYMLLLTVPEPVSKGIAAVMTATIIAYVGVDTFWGLIVGFKRLVLEADRATTFHELREAGERYGKGMGRNAARAFAMLASVAIGNTTAGLAAKVPKLPGAMQAAARAKTQMGFRLAAVGQVATVAVSAETVTIAFSTGAVAMTAHGAGSQSGSSLLENQKPKDLPGELERAQRLGVRPVSVDTPEFLKYANEGPIKWVVTPKGELKILPHTWRGLEISHAVANGGGPVLAAGEAEIVVHGRATLGLGITPRSGHYLFGATEAELTEALNIGRQAFARSGITFPQ